MKIILTIIITVLLAGCEKTVTLDYKINQSKIVIEGNISNEPGPYFVKITKSIRLTDTGDYPTIDDAVVSISDNTGNSEVLSAQGNGMYKTDMIAGTEGRTYTLTVHAENKTHVAESTMPYRVDFDSIKTELLSVLGSTEYNIIPVYRDPVGRGNYYRFLLSVNGQLIKQHLIQNDEIKNGLVNTLRLEIDDEDLELKANDIISLKMQCIDKKNGLYYTTLMLMADSGPGGGTTPNNPPGNFSNDALGIFSAHTVEEKSKILP